MSVFLSHPVRAYSALIDPYIYSQSEAVALQEVMRIEPEWTKGISLAKVSHPFTNPSTPVSFGESILFCILANMDTYIHHCFFGTIIAAMFGFVSPISFLDIDI